jgi:hypothetical protein
VLRDVNGDGVMDILASARVNGKLRRRAFSGRDLSPLPA